MSLTAKVRGLLAGAMILGVLFGLIVAWLALLYGPTELIRAPYQLRIAHNNYSDEIATIAEELELPYSYFMALTVLECSGERPCGTRFENHVFEKLQALRSGDRERYGPVLASDIVDAGDDALRNLATSWGPFQLMGYKCIDMNIRVADLRSDEAVLHGMTWIAREYGGALREGRFADAFHIHNAGRPYPKDGPPRTHDPRYVERGIRYMDYFEGRKP